MRLLVSLQPVHSQLSILLQIPKAIRALYVGKHQVLLLMAATEIEHLPLCRQLLCLFSHHLCRACCACVAAQHAQPHLELQNAANNAHMQQMELHAVALRQ